ncbi:MAG: serine kinase [Bacteroidales bacterium]|jgi:serine kinase of HPr protein (carbohydrate metabolism regulator)|nr:serine kinase [Bacteroidales bacterium]
MNVRTLVNKLNLKVVSGEKGLNNEITGGYVSDLLSDVMGNAEQGQAWITLQVHKNIMAIASLKELACIILVKGLHPNSETLEQSNEEGIPILSTELETFEIAGQLYGELQS